MAETLAALEIDRARNVLRARSSGGATAEIALPRTLGLTALDGHVGRDVFEAAVGIVGALLRALRAQILGLTEAELLGGEAAPPAVLDTDDSLTPEPVAACREISWPLFRGRGALLRNCNAKRLLLQGILVIRSKARFRGTAIAIGESL